MAMMDNMQDKATDMGDEAKQRMQELQSKEQAGTLDDSGRAELQQLRDHFDPQ